MRYRPGAFLVRCVLVLAVILAGFNLLAAGLRYPTLVLVAACIVAYRRLRRWLPSDAYGSARPSGFADLWAGGLFGDSGLIVGDSYYLDTPGKAAGLRALFSPLLPATLAVRLFLGAFFGRRWCDDTVIRVHDHIHTGIFASSGAGKGVSALIPNLLSYKQSTVVLDPQGSLFAASAGHRRKKFRHRIVRLDSSGICGPGGDSLNALDFLPHPAAADFLDGCRDLASMLVVRTGQETDPHWNDSAERVITAFICFVAACERDPAMRNLLSVRAIVSSREAYLATMNVMRQMTGVVKQQGDSLTWLTDKELNSVLSTVQRHTAWMDSPAVADSLRRSTFSPASLRAGLMSVYILQSPDRLETMAPQLRVFLGTILRVLTRGKASEANPVLFMIDETAALGRFQILENAITQSRGWGIRLFLVFQSIGQLQKCYGDNAQTVMDNLGTQLYFATRSYESCEHLSKLIGDCTVTVRSASEQTSRSTPTGVTGQPAPGNVSTSWGVNTSEIGRRWAKAEEIRTLPDSLALLFHKNMNVVPVRLLRYYDSPLFRWGRTGRSRGLGPAAGLAAACLLLCSLMIPAAIAHLPNPPTRTAMPGRFSPRPGRAAIRPFAGTVPRPAFRPTPRYPRRLGQLNGRAGTLIRIP